MKYRLTAPDKLDRQLRQITGTCLMAAATQLQHSGDQLHQDIHEARKRCKEVQAILILLRSPLGDTCTRERRRLKEIADQLAPLRDARVISETSSHLAAKCADRHRQELLTKLSRHLEACLQEVISRQSDLPGAFGAIHEALVEAVARVENWPLQQQGFKLISTGLQDCYRRGRRAYQRCNTRPDSADFHAWRKQVKAHGYHTRLITTCWPGELAGRSKALTRLGGLLGDDHDLLVLSDWLKTSTFPLENPVDKQSLLKYLLRERHKLQIKALRMGGRLYAEKPSVFTARIHGYWRCWQAD